MLNQRATESSRTAPGDGSLAATETEEAETEEAETAEAETADNEAATRAPSLRSMAATVVQRAQLQLGERILDVSGGAAIGASATLSMGRDVIGVDAAAAVLAIAGREILGAHFVRVDVVALPFSPGSFDVIVSVHGLHLAEDPVAMLAEWRRVTKVGGRLSLSVPGPRWALAMKIYDPIYRRHGVLRRVDVPTRRKLSAWARAAGWGKVNVTADPTIVIQLAGADSFDASMRSGLRADTNRATTRVRFPELKTALLAATPTTPDGLLHIPFGTLYLTAHNPGVQGPQSPVGVRPP